MSEAATAAPSRPERLDPALLRLGGVLVLGTVLAVLDATVVNVGIETIRRDFDSPLATVQWISTGYLIAFALVAPVSGWATGRFGPKRTWMASVLCFVVASALCGVAWSPGSLIVFRILQGVGGGLIQPIGQGMIARAAGPKRIGRVMSVLIIPLTFAPALGPVIGGLLIGGLGWRWIFFINLPLGALTLLLARRALPATPPQGAARLDVTGLLLVSPGLAALIYGLSVAGQTGFGTVRAYLPIVAGAALLGLYAWHALRRTTAPVLDLRLFANRALTRAVSASFLVGAALFGSMFMLPLYYQQARGASPLEAGLQLVPQDIGIAAAMFVAGRITERLGLRVVLVCGVLLTLLGTVAYTQVGSDPSEVLLAAGLFVRGLGLGAAMSPVMTAVFRSVAPEQTQQAAGLQNVLYRVGGSIGTAGLALVLQDRLATTAPAGAFAAAFWVVLCVSALTLLPAVTLPGKPRS